MRSIELEPGRSLDIKYYLAQKQLPPHFAKKAVVRQQKELQILIVLGCFVFVYTGSCFVMLASLRFTNPLASISHLLGLQVDAAMPSLESRTFLR